MGLLSEVMSVSKALRLPIYYEEVSPRANCREQWLKRQCTRSRLSVQFSRLLSFRLFDVLTFVSGQVRKTHESKIPRA
jgi:hypothetical protein